MGFLYECLPGAYPYLANIFVLKMLSAEYVRCIYSNAFYTILIMEANNMDPDQTAPKGSSLIWVHIACNTCYQSIIVCLFDSLHPSQQFFSYVGMGLSGLNPY